MTFPIGPYFKGVLKPVRMMVSKCEHAASIGTSDIKTGCNYFASILPR